MLLFAVSAAFITYLDRVCISAAAPAMTRDLGLTAEQMGYVFSVFALAYGIFEIPMGWLGDRYGQRSLLTRIVGCWSLFTVLTGMARSYWSLLVIRFAFGAAEAGAFPTMVRALARWFPLSERGFATGWMWGGARLGGSIAPPLAAWFVVHLGWRESFAVFGVLGLIWCVGFYRWYRDDPADHPAVSAEEVALIHAERGPDKPIDRVPWGVLFSNRNLWALFAMYFCSAYGFFFFVTWLPTYLTEEYGLTLERSGWYSAGPLAAGAVACVFGGSISDWLVRKTKSRRWGRRIVGVAGFVLAAVGFGGAATSGDAVSAVLWLSFAQGAQDLSLPAAWATCVDVGRRYGGSTTGFMNTASSISAMISPVSAVWFQQTFGSFNAMFAAAGIVYLVGGLLWFWIDADQTVDPAPEPSAAR